MRDNEVKNDKNLCYRSDDEGKNDKTSIGVLDIVD
jgi:hypothetical protein